jgi:hypothetical protein
MQLTRVWRAFTAFRSSRPFWGALCLLVSAAAFAIPSVSATIEGITLTLSSGSGLWAGMFVTYMLATALVALLNWSLRVPLGMLAIVVGVVSIAAVNLGGFVIGAVFGVLGGSLVAAWRAPAPAGDAPAPEEATPDVIV